MTVAVGDVVTREAVEVAVELCDGELFAGEQAMSRTTRSPAAAGDVRRERIINRLVEISSTRRSGLHGRTVVDEAELVAIRISHRPPAIAVLHEIRV
jgi:hypothetical protein